MSLEPAVDAFSDANPIGLRSAVHLRFRFASPFSCRRNEIARLGGAKRGNVTIPELYNTLEKFSLASDGASQIGHIHAIALSGY